MAAKAKLSKTAASKSAASKTTASKTTASKTGTPPKRGGPPKALARSLDKVTKRLYARQGFAEPDVITRWPAIVGPALAAFCAPVKLSFPKGQRAGASLLIRVDGAAALQLQHETPAIIERINNFCGFALVARLRLQQGPIGGMNDGIGGHAGGDSGGPAPNRPPKVPLDQAQNELLAKVPDPDLRDALRSLGETVAGEAMLRAEKQRKKP